MSALDSLVAAHLRDVCKELNPDNCVFVQDLMYLRAAAAERDWAIVDLKHMTIERDRLQNVLDLEFGNMPDGGSIIDEMSKQLAELRAHLAALYSELAAATGHEYTPDANFDAHEAISQLSERIASLKMQADMLDDYAETIRQHEITISQQAAQLEQAILKAHTIINALDSWSESESDDFSAVYGAKHDLRSWLSANTHAPQEEITS